MNTNPKPNNNIIEPLSPSELNIYEGGNLNQITVNDLLNNSVAIRQLVNNHNIKIKELSDTKEEVNNLKSQLEYLKTSPFNSIFAALVSIVGSIVVAIGVNNITTSMGICLIILGAIIILTISLSFSIHMQEVGSTKSSQKIPRFKIEPGYTL